VYKAIEKHAAMATTIAKNTARVENANSISSAPKIICATVGHGGARLKLSLSRIAATLLASSLREYAMRVLMRLLLCLCLFDAFAVTGTYANEGEGGESEKTASASEYLDIKPALITNYGGPGPVHFVKAEITLRLSKTAEANQLVTHHMPQIRHELIMLFSRQSEEALNTMQGKEQLRQDALAAVQKIMETEENKKIIEDLLFNNFVIQN
jgi:flagellar FliL protein